MSETNPEPKKPTRLVQDSPIYLEVWRKYEEVLAEYEKERKKYKAKKKKYEKEIERVGLILTPFRGVPSSTLLNLVKQNLLSIPDKQEEDLEKWQLATTGEAVVANLNLDELLEAVLPLTQWWKDNFQVNTNKESQSKNEKESEEKNKRLEEDKRLNREWLEKKIESIGFEFNNEIISSPRIPDKNKQTVLWSVSLNREAFTSLFESVPATKADAARRLFDIDGSGIKWAVLDTGIDATHIGFRKLDKNGDRVEPAMAKKDEKSEKEINNTRIIATYDFTNFRNVISDVIRLNPLDEEKPKMKVAEIIEHFAKSIINEISEEVDIANTIAQLEAGIKNGRMLDWELIEPLLRVPYIEEEYKKKAPTNPHGTHVAGIIGANVGSKDIDKNSRMIGMCPSIEIYDIRVLDNNGKGQEFNILAAIQFIRWLNSQSDSLMIHGVNLSLSMLHDVDSYAAGRTPICEACQRLVAEGTVVVVAAGNLGLSRFENPEKIGGKSDGARVASITDPGNAESVITVGSTHRSRPHTYGVSFFSSRGPTSDGRYKPDLVAPGEKITSLVPGFENSTRRMDGTSMAAPHVSGAAALLLCKHKEMIGNPMKVKEILCKTATDLGRDKYFQGCGMLDVLRALQAV